MAELQAGPVLGNSALIRAEYPMGTASKDISMAEGMTA